MRAARWIMTRMAIALVLPVLVLGCTFETEEWTEEDIGEAEEAVTLENAMWPNALSPNALSPNALSPNALSPNALSPNALAPSALSGLQDAGQGGLYSRMLLKYIVSCALTSAQSFSF